MPRIKKNLMTLDDALEEFMINCTNKDLTKKTLMSYESTLKLFFKYLEEEFNISEVEKVEEKHIKEYLDFTKERGKYSFVTDVKTTDINRPHNRTDFGKEVSIGTINNYLRNIKVFFNFCLESKYIKISPTARIRQFKATRRPKEDITDEDFRKLIKAIDTTTFHGHRDYCIFHLLMDTGMRIGETLFLNEEDVLLDKRAIFISADIAKGRRDRYVFYSVTMQKILTRWIDYKDRYLSTNLLFPSSRNNKLEVPNIDVIDYELLEDGDSVTKGGLGRAIVGGALLGRVGAIVGGTTGKRKTKTVIKSLRIKVTVNQTSNPSVYINLINTETKSSSFIYKAAYTSAQEILSMFSVVTNEVEDQQESRTTTVSTADELIKLKGLLDDGILTQEEFMAEKNKILSR
ncbi:tyrosine-type recombinase/integrase [uncultured Clostridium sp.]|uniref:tyrosine-type recombinase/integrase n=1 Tax=uncultured Clostridium sp. TaxID=59620 RepID=UPI0028E7FA15|nr:tyrosine-type recombinase/integrase [uncultured Clostridium sp.]